MWMSWYVWLHKDSSNTYNTRSSAPLQTFYFISFLLVLVYAWKSKSAIQGWRAAPPGAEVSLGRHLLPLETGNDLNPVMTHLMLPWFYRISAQRRRSPCPCMQLCGKRMPVHTTGTHILCPFPAFMLFLSVWPRRLIPIALYIGYVLTPFLKESVVIPNSDPSLTWYIRNDSKYCTRWERHLPD